ncbi:MAG: 30S ribosomal protein S21 [Bacilli bacterium]|nr:30S ribosomal protein S21 [Bacilli bacterium]
MPKTIVRDGETLDDAMKRFKRMVNKAGTIADYRKHDFFLKKGLRRKVKSENARRRH